MIKDKNQRYNQKTDGGDDSSGPVMSSLSDEPPRPSTNPKLRQLQRRHLLTEKGMILSAKLLASLVGDLDINRFSHSRTTDGLPRQSFDPDQVIPCDDSLYWIKRGSVQIRHSRHKYPVKLMTAGGVFGEMPILGQTMLVTEAVAGPSGVTVAVMNAAAARQWIAADANSVLEMIGPRLAAAERDYFRAQFQSHDSAVAALLLRLAGRGTVIEGTTQEALA